MPIIIDTNIIISGLIRNSITRKILANQNFIFLTPSFTLSEINKYKGEICIKSKLSTNEFYELLAKIMGYIRIIPEYVYSTFIEKSKRLIKDIDDVPFLALALTFNCPIWSDDKHFKMQDRVKILTTKDIINLHK